MSEFIKGALVGVGFLVGLMAVICAWIVPPLIWFSYYEGGVLQLTTLGVVWLMGPVVFILVAISIGAGYVWRDR